MTIAQATRQHVQNASLLSLFTRASCEDLALSHKHHLQTETFLLAVAANHPDLFEHLVAVAIDHTPVSALALFEALLALATSHSPAKQLAEIHFDARPTSRSEGVTQFA